MFTLIQHCQNDHNKTYLKFPQGSVVWALDLRQRKQAAWERTGGTIVCSKKKKKMFLIIKSFSLSTTKT